MILISLCLDTTNADIGVEQVDHRDRKAMATYQHHKFKSSDSDEVPDSYKHGTTIAEPLLDSQCL